MEITEVKLRLSTKKKDKVKAYATITLDNCFVIRGIRLIEGPRSLFVAMPSEPLKKPCPQCGSRIPVTNRFCPHCGIHLGNFSHLSAPQTTRDIAHPINQETRNYITEKIIEAYNQRLAELGQQPSSQGQEG